MRKLIAIAAAAALFALPAFAAPVYVPGQGGAVGPNVACTNSDGATIRCIQPSVTLNDATGAAIGTSGNPLVTSPGTGTTGDVNVKQVNGATVNVGTGAAGTGTQRVTTSTDSTIGTVTAVTAITNALPAGTAILGKVGIDQTTPGTTNGVVPAGNVASGAADSGNPVKVGCKYNSTRPTFSDGQRGDCQIDSQGNLSAYLVAATNGTPITASQATTDGVSSNNNSLWTSPYLRVFNGATWDRYLACSSSATVNVTAGSTTQIVGLSGSTVIRVCSITLSMSAAGSAGVYTGTGTNCGTGTTALIQDMTLATGTPIAQSAPSGGSLVRTSAGGELCVKAVTGNVTGSISYAQF